MLQQRIHSTLEKIAHETYPGQIKPFRTEVYAKEMRGRHGDYHPLTHTIRIFNLSRDSAFIIATAIHEVAHHAELCLHGSTGHRKSFYLCLRDLLACAIRRGFLDYNVARLQTDAADLKMLEKYFGDVLTRYRPLDQGDGMQLVKVFKAYAIKEQLKERRYRWSDLELAWCKEIPVQDVPAEKAFLSQLTAADSFSISDSRSAAVEAVYHIVVANAFQQREQLKERGYRFNGYGVKGDVWVLRLPAQQLAEAKTFLQRIGCRDYRIEGRNAK